MIEQQSLIPLSTGEELKHLREARQLSLEVVSRKLKCSKDLLIAIESDQPVTLAPVYLKGFLGAYADLLELDVGSREALIQRCGNAEPEVRSIYPARIALQSSDRWLRASSYILASLLVGTLAWQITHEAVRLANVDDGAISIPGDALPETSQPHVNASIASLESLQGLSGSRTGDAGAEAWAALARAKADAESLAAGEHWIEVTTSADSWVEIIGRNDALLEQDLVRGGETRRYRGLGPFRMSFGRSSAVTLTVDGAPVDLAPFSKDDVTQMLLDPSRKESGGNAAVDADPGA